MAAAKPDVITRVRYDKAENEYFRGLTMEHMMEATAQGTQRKITLESFDLIHAQRPDVQVFNELLILYPLPKGKIGRVTPDNMVVIHSAPIEAEGSFRLPYQPVQPFLVLEYVSKHNERKDYDTNLIKYERELKTPYYLLFYPDSLDLSIYRLTNGKKRFSSVKENSLGRLEIPELEVECALLNDWVRYWFRGELLPLPGEMLRQLNEAQRQARDERQARISAEAELTRLRAEIEQLRRRRNGA